MSKLVLKKKLDVPKEKLGEYKEAFDMFDIDKSGKISAKEISKIMKNFGNPLTPEEVKSMISKVDASGDGEVDFDEFVCLMQKQTAPSQEVDPETKRAFETFDKNKDGYISRAEFENVLSQLGQNFTEDEVTTLFNETDTDHDGKISLTEFVGFWESH